MKYNIRLLRVFIALGLVAFFLAPDVRAAVLNVPGGYATIQSAIDSASAGDTVQVAAGTYYENITLKDGITVQGMGADVCNIEGNGTTATVLALNITQPAALYGFTISGGKGYTVSWSENRIMGGGIFADQSTLSIANNIITGNQAQIGGGIAFMNSHANVSGNTIISNNATTANPAFVNMGGGLYIYDTKGDFSDNTISQNTVSCGELNPGLIDAGGHMAPGGGICVVFSKSVGDLRIQQNTISENIATGSQHYGGGIYIFQADGSLENTITVSGNAIMNNQGLDGGGIALITCSANISGNTITGNSAHWGAGLYGFSGAGTISQNTFSGNNAIVIRPGVKSGGGGLLCDDGFSPLISGNTFSSNTAADYGGGIEVYGSTARPKIQSNRLVNNSAPFGGGLVIQAAVPAVMRNYFYGNQATTQSGGGVFVENTPAFQMANNLFVENQAAGYGGGISVVNGGSPHFVNNTLVGNTAGLFGGGIHTLASSFTIMNNIIFNNTHYGIFCDGGTPINSYNDVYGNTEGQYYGISAGTGAISANPSFKNATTYVLNAGSPCQNAGNPDKTYNNPDGSRNDMGAYGGPNSGYIPSSETPPPAPVLTITTVGVTATISWSFEPNAEGYTLFYAPFPYTGPASIRSVSMGSGTHISVSLWEGAAFYLAVQAYNPYGSSSYSNIGLLSM